VAVLIAVRVASGGRGRQPRSRSPALAPRGGAVLESDEVITRLLLASGFAAAGGSVIPRWTAKQGQTISLPRWPRFDVLFFGGIKEGAYILKDMRKAGLNQVFACGDGCWSANGFIKPAEGAATQGEGVRILSAAPAVGEVPGSAEFADRYRARFGPINNYAASSYDSARIVMAAIEAAPRRKAFVRVTGGPMRRPPH
jgi:branched-chain amino acid transport system substrate-binding protein